jgi:hypothetical protein
MPRDLPPGLLELLRRKDRQIESHTTLLVSVNTSAIRRDYHFASARLTIDGSVYEPELRKSGEIRQSLTHESDLGTVDLQNADAETGKEFLSLGDDLYFAETVIGRWWKDHLSLAEYHVPLLTGVLVGLEVEEEFTRLTAVSEPFAEISVGASRLEIASCSYIFRDPTTCTYNGNLMTCNLLYDNPNGCSGRHGSPLFRARYGGLPSQNSGSRLLN